MSAETATAEQAESGLRCRLCGDSAELLYPGVNDWADTGAFAPSSHEVGAHGDLYVCQRCGTVQTGQLPSDDLLESRYAATDDGQYLAEEAGRRRTAQRLLDLLEQRVSPGRLLDIGCGHGLLMAEARDRGWDPIGLELSRSAAAHARDLGLGVLEQTIDDAALAPESFDAIVAVDLIEHLPNPREFVRCCRRLLAPGGALVVATPDPESPMARIFGRRWWGYIPAHLHLLPRRMLRELMQAEGLVLTDDVTMVRDFSFEYWVAGFAGRGRLLRWIEPALGRLPLGKRTLGVALGDERVVLATRAEPLRAAPSLATREEQRPSVHAVLPAYRAAATLPDVAQQLPGEALNRALVVDDASTDETASVAHRQGFDVIVHPTNRGYGANQKTCYVSALRDGADVVVMVHADNQYDPRLVPEMIAPIIAGDADVVIGSRLLNDRAIVGGMPRWKWVGNKFLTWAENRAFRRTYSEYHTGYRAFSAEFLRSVAFLRNSDAFVFDQEIFAQAVANRAKVHEIAIPTRYFLEASSVSFRESVKYGLRTLLVLARFRAHEADVWRWPLLNAPAFMLHPERDLQPVVRDRSAGVSPPD
ncbi:MAG TPA: methyltransferase domain-containing protein [Solirubrobacteraceae bacterium]|nr:methyltransferase domain-containing protein [Solirubrobacteraceae bacterium]